MHKLKCLLNGYTDIPMMDSSEVQHYFSIKVIGCLSLGLSIPQDDCCTEMILHCSEIVGQGKCYNYFEGGYHHLPREIASKNISFFTSLKKLIMI